MNTRVVFPMKAVAAKARVLTHAPSALLQRKCDCGGSAGHESECEECKKKKLQRRAAGAGGHTGVPPVVHEVLRSPGEPLSPAVRGYVEPRFGHDFSRVRVHADEKAAESARAVNAFAYTVGQDIVFGKGLFAPHTNAGHGLLGHELTHVVQNGGAPAGDRIELGSASSEAEAEAEANSTSSVARPITVQDRGAVLRRQQAKPQSCSGWTCLAELNKCDSPDPGKEGTGQPSSSWMLTALIDVDVPTPAEVGPTTFGHSYVKFTESNGAEYTFGFYPRTRADVLWGSTRDTPGCIVHPDLTHLPCVDYEEKFPLQKSEYDKALDNAKKWCHASPSYHLFDVNCTTFVAKVVESAGKTLPPYRGKVSSAGKTADNPNTLLESLQARDKASEQANAAAKQQNRQKENAEIVEYLHKLPPTLSQPQPTPQQQAPQALLVPPGARDQGQAFNPLQGASGGESLADAREAVARGKAETKKLVDRGKQLLVSHSQAEIDAFKRDEEIWRKVITYWLNYFTDHGPDEVRRGYDELLHSNEYGERLAEIRKNFGG